MSEKGINEDAMEDMARDVEENPDLYKALADEGSNAYMQVLKWEEDVLEDREKSLRMEGRDTLAEAYHRRLQEVKTRIRTMGKDLS